MTPQRSSAAWKRGIPRIHITLVVLLMLVAAPAVAQNHGLLEFWQRDNACNYSHLGPSLIGARSTWGLILGGNFGSSPYSDVFCYDPSKAEGEFRSTDGTGGDFSTIGATLSVRDSWSIIVGGDFGPSPYDDLFFFDALVAEGEFWSTDGLGNIAQIGSTWTELRGEWRIIVPGDFSSSTQDDLMLYDSVLGEIVFVSTETRFGIGTPVSTRKSWTTIVAGDFGGSSSFADLFLYDAAAGEGQFVQTDGSGGIANIGPVLTGLRKSWTKILAGRFDPPCGPTAITDDLYFYDAADPRAEFWATNGAGGISMLGSTPVTSPTWGLTATGTFAPGSLTQLLHYDPRWPASAASNLYVAAHEDDDFLFMNPDIRSAIVRRERVRITYLTSGQLDFGSEYWRDGRERGILNGYAHQADVPGSSWVLVQAGTPGIYRLAAYPLLEVEFLRLPSSIENGAPYGRYGHSLHELWIGDVESLTTVDSLASFTRASLIEHLVGVMVNAQVTRLGTLDPQNWSGTLGERCRARTFYYATPGFTGNYDYDHVDHCTSARFAVYASQQYPGLQDIVGFIGYSSAMRPVNVTGDDHHQKLLAFNAYGSCDPLVGAPAPFGGLYDSWITRQYTVDPTVTEVASSPLTRSLGLHQNSPNPFHPATEIAFDLPLPCAVELTVYDVSGRRVAGLLNTTLGAGRHMVRWSGSSDDGAGVPSGVYYYTLKTPGNVASRKMIVVAE